MSKTQPVLKTQSEIVDEICRKIGKGFSLRQARQALSEAMEMWSQDVCLCFCKLMPEALVCGRCEYDCGCCGVDDITPYIQRANCGCGYNDCWHEFNQWKMVCGKLTTNGRVEGRLKIEYRVPNPPIQWRKLELSSTYEEGYRTIWIEGRIENLPPAGYLKVCDHWVSYQCHAQVAITEDNLFESVSSEAWLNPDEVIESDLISRSGQIYDGVSEIKIGPPCGIHTVLHEVEEICSSVHRSHYYSIGTEVEFGVGASDTGLMSYLSDLTMVAAYEARVTECATDTERESAFTMISYYREKAAAAAKRVPRRRHRALVDTDCWRGNGGYKANSRYISGRSTFGARSKVYY